jgi:hypothetical protein
VLDAQAVLAGSLPVQATPLAKRIEPLDRRGCGGRDPPSRAASPRSHAPGSRQTADRELRRTHDSRRGLALSNGIAPGLPRTAGLGPCIRGPTRRQGYWRRPEPSP